MAKAQELYDITICHHLWMSNHPHLLVVTKCPSDLPKFIGYLKAESAQMINMLLGRKRKTIWLRSYHLCKIAGPEKAKEQIAYLYNNPTKADLEDSIELYPGLNSWQQFLAGVSTEIECTKVPRSKIPALPLPALSKSAARRYVEVLESENHYKCTLRIEPNAWMQCFRDTRDEDPCRINAQIIALVRAEESQYRERRKRENKRVIGATTLRRANMLAEYESKKFSKSLLIMGDDPDIIHDYLYRYFSKRAQAKKVYQAWKEGHLHKQMPPGMIPPRPPERASFWSAREL